MYIYFLMLFVLLFISLLAFEDNRSRKNFYKKWWEEPTEDKIKRARKKRNG